MFGPLLSLYRGQCEEIGVYGEIFIDAGRKGTYSTLGTSGLFSRYPARSTLKPFQFLASGTVIHKSANRERLAACVGSPSGTLDQIEKLIEWYSDFGWQELKTTLPVTWPLDAQARVILQSQGEANPIFGMCFSKHMNIIQACHKNRWDIRSYAKRAHPFHKRLEKLLKLQLKRELDWVVDGCGLLSPTLSLCEMAGLYRYIAIAHEMKAIRDLFLDFPQWIGGLGRADTGIMGCNAGKVLAKEGADGLICLSILADRKFPDGVGIAIKLSHGLDHRMLGLVAGPCLLAFKLKPVRSEVSGHEVRYHFTPFAREDSWCDISPINQDKSPVFPGDTHYQRKVLLDTRKGSHLTLSAIETTVHIGAHADAPNHFSKDPRGIDSVSVEPYLGLCQVIEVKNKKGMLGQADIQGIRILAPRVVFKTNSFRSRAWHDDFVTLSEEVITLLGNQRVCLVGIDTPSIDPVQSKSLAAHKATLAFDMRILEGLDLRRINEGLYDLVAAPLRLDGADASPVRALLRRLP